MKNKNKSIIGFILSVIQTFILVIFVVVAIFSYSYKLPFLSRFSLTFYSVISGSMEPAIPTGSIIYSGKYKLEDLKKGDIVTYRAKDNATIVTHRIDQVNITEVDVITADKKDTKKMVRYGFVTKGDANGTADADEVLPNQILGKYQWNIPRLGYLSSFAQTPKGFAIVVVLPTTVLVVWELISLILYFRNKYEQKSKTEIEELKKQLAKKKTKND